MLCSTDIDKMPLVQLDVSTNLIRRLPTSLRNILSLVVLEVADNPLESPPSHVRSAQCYSCCLAAEELTTEQLAAC